MLLLGGHHRNLLLCDLLDGLMLGRHWLRLLLCVLLDWSFLGLAGQDGVGQLLWRKGAHH
jgi:hypothetical protein